MRNREQSGSPLAATFLGLCTGWGLAHYLDPVSGRRRRAEAIQQGRHMLRLGRRLADQAARDARNRTYGMFAEAKSAFSHEPVDDETLIARVRSCAGRVSSHPHALTFEAKDGVVTASGPILVDEAECLVKTISKVRGVKEVHDQLTRHSSAEAIPALQGGVPRKGSRPSFLQTNWPPATRVILGGLGLAMTGRGLARRGALGLTLALGGGILFGRAATNQEVGRFLGLSRRRRGIDIQKTVTVMADVDQVYEFLSNYENYPRFMDQVLEVRDLGEGRTSWVMRGPAGARIHFDARETVRIENERLAWKTIGDPIVRHAGIIQFESNPDGSTRVHLRMTYSPPGGFLGHALASLFGTDPKSELDRDMVRLKSLIETGKGEIRHRAIS